MLLDALGLTFDFAGKVLIALSVIRLHTHLGKERKIDKALLAEIEVTKRMAMLGILLLAAGYIIQLQGAL
jgi:hypothetical protein